MMTSTPVAVAEMGFVILLLTFLDLSLVIIILQSTPALHSHDDTGDTLRTCHKNDDKPKASQ